MLPKTTVKGVLALLTVLLAGLLSLTPALAAGGQGSAPAGDPSEPSESAAPADPAGDGSGGSGTVLGVSAGTAVLMGAGLFTHVRGKLKEGKPEREYVHFENHTRPYDPETGKFHNE